MKVMAEFDEFTDEALMLAYQKGEEQAFKVLYRRHSSKIYGFIRKKISDSGAVEDVFQAAFLKLHRSRGQYNPTFLFLPWMFTICRTSIIDSLRKQGRTKETLRSERIKELNESKFCTQEKIEQGHLPNWEVIPQGQRQALELRYTDDLTFAEIAKRLETTPGNVRQLISRAIRRLRRQ